MAVWYIIQMSDMKCNSKDEHRSQSAVEEQSTRGVGDTESTVRQRQGK